MFENWSQLMENSVEGMELVEEKDWGLPWPEFNQTDEYCSQDDNYNIKIFEYNILTMPFNKSYSEELDRLLKLEESKRKVRKMIAARTRYIKMMVRKLFKIKTDKMSRTGYNYYTRLISSLVSIYGFNTVYSLDVRIAVFSMAFTFALVVN